MGKANREDKNKTQQNIGDYIQKVSRPEKKCSTKRLVSKIVFPALLIILGTLAYANSFNCPFIFDDKPNILKNPYVRHLWPLSKAMSAPPRSGIAGRPTLSLSLAINYAISGYSVWSYHAVNLTIHILAALTLYAIVRRTLVSKRLVSRFGNKAAPLAWAIAAIWLVHPIQTQSVTYIIQRAEALMGLFFLLTLYAAIRAMQSPRQTIWSIVSVLCCALGMATKEVMATTPLLVLLYDRAFGAGSFASAIRRRWSLYIGLTATWAVLAVLMLSIPRSDTIGFSTGISALDYALSQFGVIVHYFRLCIWPSGLCLDYGWPLAKNFSRVILPMPVIILIVGTTLWGLVRNFSWSYPAVWLLGILTPTSSFIPIADLAFEHRMYLPSAGLAVLAVIFGYLLLGQTASRFPASKKIYEYYVGGILVIAIVVTLTLMTIRRNQDYQSPLSIWQTVVSQAPKNPRGHTHLGLALESQGRFNEAIKRYRLALQLEPNYSYAYAGLAHLLNRQGKLNEAVEHYNQALQIGPPWSEPLNNLAWIFAVYKETKFHNPKDAIRLAEKACELTNYQQSDMLDTLAAAYAADGRFPDAVITAEKARKLAISLKQTELIEQIQNRLRLYKAAQPYVEPLPKTAAD